MVSDRQPLTASLAAAAPVIVAAVSLGLIAPRLMPGVGYWDTAEFQTVAPVLGTAHPTGFPTYVILGFLANLVLAPFGEPAFRMNIFSALSIAAAAGLTTAVIRALTGRTAVAAAAGLGFATTPIAWSIGTHADPHSLHVAFVGLVLLLLVVWQRRRAVGAPTADRWLVGAAFAFAVGAANHSLMLLLAPGIGLYVLAAQPGIIRRPRLVAACVAVLAVTLAALYLELPIRAGIARAPLVYGTPDTWSGFWYVVVAQQFHGNVGNVFGDLPTKLGSLAAFAVSQLGPLALLVPVGFVAAARRFPSFALLSGVSFVVTVAFSASYTDADISRYYLGPALIAWTWLGILAAVAVDHVVGLAGARAQSPARSTASPAATVAAVAAAIVLLAPTALVLTSRAAAADEHGNRSAQAWLDATMPAFAPRAVIVSWWSYSTTLWYGQIIERLRPDIFIVDDRTRLDLNYGEATDVIARFIDTRPVYVIRVGPGDLAKVMARYQLEPLGVPGVGNVWRVTRARP